jgi:uncharacterized protein (TIGR02391 family)
VLSIDWPDEQTARNMSSEDLAVAVLFELALQPAPSQLLHRGGFLNYVVDDERQGWCPGGRIVTTSIPVGGSGPRQYRDGLKQMVGEAWDMLRGDGYLTADPGQGRNTEFVVLTQRGRDLVARPRSRAIEWARAVAALNHPLHPRLLSIGVDATFKAGRLDAAIRDAFRDIEHCVREMSGIQASSAVPLMEKAFAANAGPLADRAASNSQQNALQRLFMGAFGCYRNAPNHAYVDYGPGEAVEIVLLASLLLRELDKVGTRIGTMPIDVSMPAP